jgi:isoleucyl-tRNA synthetase
MNYILLEKRLDSIYKDLKKAKFTVLDRMKGSALKGMQYVPLFDYFVSEYQSCGAFHVYTDTYVADDAGTGIVHQAPAFGEDDHRIALAAGIITEEKVPCPVDGSGMLQDPVTHYKGMYFKDADKAIQKDLKAKNRLIRQSTITHSYPFCWRSETPLMYRVVPSWFIRVANIREQLCTNNQNSRWVPQFVQEKRFHNWLANARDWNVSRNRYWGTPIPLWANEDFSEIVCISSIEELERLSGVKNITDIHRHHIDHITIPSKTGNGVLRRVEEVFDCWFESGSMPYAQQHYPFENQELFKKSFPADFIAEGIDQTRGWFYTLMVLSTHLFEKAPFKNLIVNGLILASDGKKMSKRLKNYPDPNHVLNTYGADSLRLYLINSPAVRGDNLPFKEEGVREIVSKVLLPWYNSCKFFLNQVALIKQEFKIDFRYESGKVGHTNPMDKWILASMQSLISFVRKEMEGYRLYTVVPRLLKFIEDLTNMYVRYNRKRLKCEGGAEDGVSALNTLFEILLSLCKVMAPFTPFLSESMYQTLKVYLPVPQVGSTESKEFPCVHFQPFPSVKTEYFDTVLERQVGRMQAVIELGRIVRDRRAIGLKMPLRELVVLHDEAEYLADVKSLETYIKEELNVRKITLTSEEEKYNVAYRAEADFRVLGIKLRKDMPKVKNGLSRVTSAEVKQFAKTGHLLVEGITLFEGDINVIRYYSGTSSNWEAANDKEVLIVMDMENDKELEREALSREVVNRVQKLRKRAGLVPTDLVHYFYQLSEDPNDQLKAVFASQDQYILKVLKRSLQSTTGVEKNEKFIICEEQEINGSKFGLTLVWT